MIKGLMCPVEEESLFPTEKENTATLERMKKYWNLGPEKASSSRTDNADFWQNIAKVWDIKEEEARKRLCANCEYFNNVPEMMTRMDDIPDNKYDVDGGGRGFCVQFDFICHNLRTCMAWERKDFESED